MIGELPPSVKRYSVARGKTVIESFELRPPGPADVVVEVAGSAIGAQPGAEISGRVVAAGEAAAEWLERRVVVPRVLPCGECANCRRGRIVACPTRAMRFSPATHETVPARYLLALDPPLDPPEELWRMAALADAAAAPYGAIVRAQLAPGDLCIVIGGGVRGRFAIAIARAKGAHVAVLDGDPDRRALAVAAGARFALDGAALDAAGARDQLFGEARAAGIETVELKVIETTSTGAARRRAVALLGDGGVAALLADGDGVSPIADLDALAEREATVVGAGACHPDLLPELAALVVRGDLVLAPQVVAMPFEAFADALDSVRCGRIARLPILTP